MPGSPSPVWPTITTPLTQPLLRTTARSGQAGFPIRGEQTEGGILKASIQERPDHLLVLLILIGLKTNTDKGPGGLNEFLLREQTVLRAGIARSEHPRNTATGRCRSHEENRAIGPPRLIQGGIPGSIPGHSGLADRLRARSEVIRAGASLPKNNSSGQGGDQQGAQ